MIDKIDNNIINKEDEIKTIYAYPWSIFKKHFPSGTKQEFNNAFISFDVSKEEFNELVGKDSKHHVCWETVIFDLSTIKSPLSKKFNINKIPNTFRKHD